jgi:hypothetical protein
MGYYFGYRFIKNHIEDVRNSLNPNIDRYVNHKYPDLLRKRILGIHLRLGIGSDNNPAIVVPADYYNKILEIERGNFDEIYIVSDNTEKARNFINNLNIDYNKIIIIENEPMFVDMLILSKCITLIIAPSTLSAWSAYLNKHNNIYVPKIWVHHHWTSDIPKEWKLL